MLRTILGAALAFSSSVVMAQSFDVAVVKPAAPQPAGMMQVRMRGGPGTPDPGQLTYSNVTLKNVLTNAYDLKASQISGPAWLDSERYDITAKIPSGATKEQFKAMLRNLMAERFKMTEHRETKEMPLYALVVGKNGPKLKESADDASAKDGGGPGSAGGGSSLDPGRITIGKDGMPQLPPGAVRKGTVMMVTNGRMRMNANQQTMPGLCDMLSNQLDRPVTDMTGLKGTYDFTLDFVPDESMRAGRMGGGMPMPGPSGGEGHGPLAGSPDDETGASLFTAVQEQLGLKLEPRKGPMELLVIDHLEKVATEN